MTEERKETFEEEVNQSERIDADEEPLSRMSRNASRQSKQKQKQSRNRARNAVYQLLKTSLRLYGQPSTDIAVLRSRF